MLQFFIFTDSKKTDANKALLAPYFLFKSPNFIISKEVVSKTTFIVTGHMEDHISRTGDNETAPNTG
jgi:hypothetical protein